MAPVVPLGPPQSSSKRDQGDIRKPQLTYKRGSKFLYDCWEELEDNAHAFWGRLQSVRKSTKRRVKFLKTIFFQMF